MRRGACAESGTAIPRSARTLVRSATLVATLAPIAAAPLPLAAQRTPAPDVRAAIASLDVPALDFEQPEVIERSVLGVDVLMLEDRALPLVTVHAYFRGGYGRFDRARYAAAMGLPAMLRYGGTTARTPLEVDEALDRDALQVAFGSGGGSVTSSMNTLTERLDTALSLWAEMLAEPRFDADEVEAWRARQLESVRRRTDDPGRLAVVELNRLLFGDHPVGWELEVTDLTPEVVAPDPLHWVHERVICRDNLVLGFTGDLTPEEAARHAARLVRRIPPCAEPLPDAPTPDIRRAPGVFLVPKALEQAVVVMAHPTSVRLSDERDYYAALIGNSILGGGGFSSRIMRRVRTEEGFAYTATSLWTMPREHDGVVGAMTRTRPDAAVPAIDVILSTMRELQETAPTDEEVRTTVDQIVNGFVFNFDSAAQMVSRAMFYRALELPDDWLERYWRGVQAVDPDDVLSVLRTHLRPDEMTILIVGDPDRLDPAALARFGAVTMLGPG